MVSSFGEVSFLVSWESTLNLVFYNFHEIQFMKADSKFSVPIDGQICLEDLDNRLGDTRKAGHRDSE